MNRNRRFRKVLAALVALLASFSVAPFSAKATPPSNISFTPVGRATLPEFDVKRKEKDPDWEMRLEARQPIDVATQIVTFQPGGYSGWHTHPGPV
jgi:hypothetical protein